MVPRRIYIFKRTVHTELPRTEEEMRREKGVQEGGYHMTGPGIEMVFLLDASGRPIPLINMVSAIYMASVYRT